MITDGAEVQAAADPRPARTQEIGTIVEVRTAEQFPDGRWMLLAAGVARARLGSLDRFGAYLTVDADPLPEEVGDAAAASRLLPAVQAALDAYMATVKRFVVANASKAAERPEMPDVAASLDQVLKPIHLPDDPLSASYAVGGLLQIELSRKQQLLELPDAASRLRVELELLRREARLLSDGAMPPVSTSDLRYNPN
jgi:Lon protease-like protein